jgi:hypothetical protein
LWRVGQESEQDSEQDSEQEREQEREQESEQETEQESEQEIWQDSEQRYVAHGAANRRAAVRVVPHLAYRPTWSDMLACRLTTPSKPLAPEATGDLHHLICTS